VIDFLSSLPEEAIEEILQLARLQRERRQLRSSLEIRLRDLKKPGSFTWLTRVLATGRSHNRVGPTPGS